MSRNEAQKEGGVVFIEFLAAILLTFFSMLCIFDLGRIYLIQAVLLTSTQEALRAAQTIEAFEIDLQQEPERYEEFQMAREKVVQAAFVVTPHFLDAISMASNQSALNNYSINSTLGYGRVEEILPVMILRPGESARIGKKGSENWVDHPQVCSPHSRSCDVPIVHPDSRSCHAMARLLRAAPIVVEMRLDFNFTLPMLDSFELIQRAVGYRDVIPHFAASLANEEICRGAP